MSMNAEKQSKEIVSRLMEGACSSKPMGFEDHRATFILLYFSGKM